MIGKKGIKIGIALLILLSSVFGKPQQVEARSFNSFIMPSGKTVVEPAKVLRPDKSQGGTYTIRANSGDSAVKIQRLLNLNANGEFDELIVILPEASDVTVVLPDPEILNEALEVSLSYNLI